MSARINMLTRHYVTLCCSRPELWRGEIVLRDSVNGTISTIAGLNVTSDLAHCIPQADLILVTYPSFMRRDAIQQLTPYLQKGSMLGFIPGYGGVEFFIEPLVSRGVIVFGFDRVPCVSRADTHTKSVNATFKTTCRLAAIPSMETERVCQSLEPLLGLSVMPLNNYLTVTLTPSNPILHTSRLYSLFHSYAPDHIFPDKKLFYGEWDLASSILLLECDREMQQLCSAARNVDVLGVVPLSVHYESETALEMTQKLRNIPTLKKIEAPLRRAHGGYAIDHGSRYFTEDFPYGLCVIKGFCIIYGIETPYIDQVLNWYQGLCGKEYFAGDLLGRDIRDTSAPQVFGICTVDHVGSFYNR